MSDKNIGVIERNILLFVFGIYEKKISIWGNCNLVILVILFYFEIILIHSDPSLSLMSFFLVLSSKIYFPTFRK